MAVEFVPRVSILDKVLATAIFAFIVGGYNFCDSRKSAAGLRDAVSQID
jgi:hypothetical protein